MSSRLSNWQCAHQWAHQLMPSGYGSNFYYEGPVIYSYGNHFPIAFLSGHNVYFTQESYSRTTAKHKSITLSAISHKRILYVNHVPSSWHQFHSVDWINWNLSTWANRIQQLQAELLQAPRRRSLANRISQEVSRMVEFCDSLQLNILGLIGGMSVNEITTIYDSWKNRLELQVAQNLKTNIEEELRKWHLHEIENLNSEVEGIMGSQALLRVSQDKLDIETSKGIRVSVEVAKRFYKFVRKNLLTAEKLENCKFIQYEVTEISKERLVIGCHTISMGEVDAIASELDWKCD